MRKIQFDNNKNVISQRLRQLRMENGLTQAQLAAKMQVLGVNLDQQMISKMEHNTRFVTDYELAFLCIALHVTPAEMLEDFYQRWPK